MRQQKEVWKRFRLIFIRLFPIGVTKFLTHFSPVCHYVGSNPLVCIVNQWTFLTKVARLVWKELKCYADKMLCWRSKSPLEYGGNPVKKSNTKTGGYFLFGANVGRLCCCFCSCFCLFIFLYSCNSYRKHLFVHCNFSIWHLYKLHKYRTLNMKRDHKIDSKLCFLIFSYFWLSGSYSKIYLKMIQ